MQPKLLPPSWIPSSPSWRQCSPGDQRRPLPQTSQRWLLARVAKTTDAPVRRAEPKVDTAACASRVPVSMLRIAGEVEHRITSLSATLAEAVAIIAKQEIVQRERTCAVVVAVRIELTRVPAGAGVVRGGSVVRGGHRLMVIMTEYHLNKLSSFRQAIARPSVIIHKSTIFLAELVE